MLNICVYLAVLIRTLANAGLIWFNNRRFLKGQNFMPWFTRRRAVAEREQHRLWKQARLKTDIQQFLSKMSELEVVDSFNAIERHLLGELQVT